MKAIKFMAGLVLASASIGAMAQSSFVVMEPRKCFVEIPSVGHHMEKSVDAYLIDGFEIVSGSNGGFHIYVYTKSSSSYLNRMMSGKVDKKEDIIALYQKFKNSVSACLKQN